MSGLIDISLRTEYMISDLDTKYTRKRKPTSLLAAAAQLLLEAGEMSASEHMRILTKHLNGRPYWTYYFENGLCSEMDKLYGLLPIYGSHAPTDSSTGRLHAQVWEYLHLLAEGIPGNYGWAHLKALRQRSEDIQHMKW